MLHALRLLGSRHAQRIKRSSVGEVAVRLQISRRNGTDAHESFDNSEEGLRSFLQKISLKDRDGNDVDAQRFVFQREINMPDMGEGEGHVVEWLFEEGDLIQRGDILCDIQTPDFVYGMQIDDEEPSILWKRLVDPKVKVRDEQTICVVLHDGDNTDQ